MPSATIIGAGPAGAAAALILARNAWSVVLVEQHDFPRHKVCGECLSSLGIGVLDRLGLLGQLECADPAKLDRTCIRAGDGSVLRVDLPRVMWGISRWVLDDMLLRAACAAGAELRTRCRCEAIEPRVMAFSPSPCTQGEGGGEGSYGMRKKDPHPNPLPVYRERGLESAIRPQVVVRRLLDNTIESWKSDWVLLADGKGAMLAPHPRPTGDLGVKAHFAGVNGRRDTVELFGVNGHYVGVAAIEAGRWNVAMSVPAHRLAAYRGDCDALFTDVLGENRGLAAEFASAARLTPWLAAPLPRFGVARSWPPEIIPLGNAAAALEPIGGEGIGLALRSAELAAEAMIHGDGATALPQAFNHLWQPRRAACRFAAWIVSRPRLAGPALELAAAHTRLVSATMRLIGKESA